MITVSVRWDDAVAPADFSYLNAPSGIPFAAQAVRKRTATRPQAGSTNLLMALLLAQLSAKIKRLAPC